MSDSVGKWRLLVTLRAVSSSRESECKHIGIFDAVDFQIESDRIALIFAEGTVAVLKSDINSILAYEKYCMLTFKINRTEHDTSPGKVICYISIPIPAIPIVSCPDDSEQVFLDGLQKALKFTTSLSAENSFVEFSMKFPEAKPLTKISRALSNGLPLNSHDPQEAYALLSRYSFQDLGLTLIYGPLPDHETSYNAEDIFRIEPEDTIEAKEGYGYGLIFKVENEQANVQFGAGVHNMSTREIVRNFQTFITGLPFPPNW
jgi:hypothetical protein